MNHLAICHKNANQYITTFNNDSYAATFTQDNRDSQVNLWTNPDFGALLCFLEYDEFLANGYFKRAHESSAMARLTPTETR